MSPYNHQDESRYIPQCTSQTSPNYQCNATGLDVPYMDGNDFANIGGYVNGNMGSMYNDARPSGGNTAFAGDQFIPDNFQSATQQPEGNAQGQHPMMIHGPFTHLELLGYLNDNQGRGENTQNYDSENRVIDNAVPSTSASPPSPNLLPDPEHEFLPIPGSVSNERADRHHIRVGDKFLCTYQNCCTEFKSKEQARNHIRKDHYKQPKCFYCPICNKSRSTFRSHYEAERHRDREKARMILDRNKSKTAHPRERSH